MLAGGAPQRPNRAPGRAPLGGAVAAARLLTLAAGIVPQPLLDLAAMPAASLGLFVASPAPPANGCCVAIAGPADDVTRDVPRQPSRTRCWLLGRRDRGARSYAGRDDASRGQAAIEYVAVLAPRRRRYWPPPHRRSPLPDLRRAIAGPSATALCIVGGDVCRAADARDGRRSRRASRALRRASTTPGSRSARAHGAWRPRCASTRSRRHARSSRGSTAAASTRRPELRRARSAPVARRAAAWSLSPRRRLPRRSRLRELPRRRRPLTRCGATVDRRGRPRARRYARRAARDARATGLRSVGSDGRTLEPRCARAGAVRQALGAAVVDRRRARAALRRLAGSATRLAGGDRAAAGRGGHVRSPSGASPEPRELTPRARSATGPRDGRRHRDDGAARRSDLREPSTSPSGSCAVQSAARRSRWRLGRRTGAPARRERGTIEHRHLRGEREDHSDRRGRSG